MSLMEKFFILFQTDAGELTKELDKAETSAQDLAKEIDKVGKVDTDKVKELPPTVTKAKEEATKLTRELSKGEAQAKRMGQSFLNVAKGLAAPVLAFASITGAVAGAVARAGEIEGLAKVADQSRIAVGDLDALGRAARDLGGDVNAAQNDIKTLSDKALEALANRGGEAAQSFKGLGLTLKNQNGEIKNTNDILLGLADATAKMSNVKATDKLKKLGITDSGMIKLILAGKKAVLEHVEAQKKASEITEQQVEAARKYKAAQNEFSDATTGVANELVGALLPSITSIVKGLTSFIGWCKEHKTVVVGFFSAIALIVTAAYLPAMVAAAVATLAATWPILAIIAACAAFALVLEDVMAYLNGQPSLLGDLAAKYKWVANTLKFIGDAWEYVKNKAEPVVEFLKSIWGMIVSLWNGDIDGFKQHFFNALNSIWNILSSVGDNCIAIFNSIAAAFQSAFDAAISAVQEKIEPLISLLKSIWGAVVCAWNGDLDGFKEHFFNILKSVEDIWFNMWDGFTAIIDTIVQQIREKLTNMIPQWVRDRLGWGENQEQSQENWSATDAIQQGINQARDSNSSTELDQPKNEPLGALEFQPIAKVEQAPIIIQPSKDGVQRVDNDVVPGLNPVAPSTVQPAQNQIKATAATPIPANPVQKQEVKKDVNVSVAAPNITINNTTDTEAAANAAASKVSGMLNREINKAIANSADGVAR